MVKRQMDKRGGREEGQDLQAGLGSGEGLAERGRSKGLLERKFITRELNQYGGCYTIFWWLVQS